MVASRRQLLILGVLAVALAIVLGRSFLSAGAADRGRATGMLGSRKAPSFVPALATRVVALDTAALVAQAGEFSPGRDLWRFGSTHVVQQLPPIVRTPPPPVMREEPREVVPERPRPPAVDVKFLGSFGPTRRKIAVFSDGEDNLINALVGDIVNKRFQVRSIGFESVELGFVDFPDESPARLALDGGGGR